MSTLDDALVPTPGRELNAAHRAAELAARAVEKGEARWCPRVKAFVSSVDCLSRHAAALAVGGYNPCLECASVVALVKKNGGPMPRAVVPKKETPSKILDGIRTMNRAVVAPQKTDSAVCTEIKKLAHPFTGWAKYELNPGPSRREQPAAYLSTAALRLNAAALALVDVPRVQSVDVFVCPGRIGLLVYPDDAGILALTPEKKRGGAATLSARGLLKSYDLGSAVGRLYVVRRVGPNALEVDLEQEAKS